MKPLEAVRAELARGRIIDAESYTAVDPYLWGVHHFLMLFNLEARCVSYRGCIDLAGMRTDSRLHSHLLVGAPFDDVYPTQLKVGYAPGPHDDWSCLADLVLAGLLDYQAPSYPFSGRIGNVGKVSMTAEGWLWAGSLRQHVAAFFHFDTFDPAAWGLL